jgi:hypothetical protein
MGPMAAQTGATKNDDFCSWSRDDGYVIQLLPGSMRLTAEKLGTDMTFPSALEPPSWDTLQNLTF